MGKIRYFWCRFVDFMEIFGEFDDNLEICGDFRKILGNFVEISRFLGIFRGKFDIFLL